MNAAGMHDVVARNVFASPYFGVNGNKILLFPSNVTMESIELAFETPEYSEFIATNCVGSVDTKATKIVGDISKIVLSIPSDGSCSGIGFIKKYPRLTAFVNNAKSFVAKEFLNLVLYRADIINIEAYIRKTSSATASALTLAQINAVVPVSAPDPMENIRYCTEFANVSTQAYIPIGQSTYSGGSTYADVKTIQFKYKTARSFNCFIFKAILTGYRFNANNNFLQIWAKVEGNWVSVATNPINTMDLTLHEFDEVTASEFRINIYGTMVANNSENTVYNMMVGVFGNTDVIIPDETVTIDKAVLIPYASTYLWNDPTVEKAEAVPAFFMEAGIGKDIDLLYNEIKVGETIPFVDSTILIGV